MITAVTTLAILLGGLCFWVGTRPPSPLAHSSRASRHLVDRLTGSRKPQRERRIHQTKIVLALLAGVVGWVWTGWVGCLVVVPVAVFGLPFLLSSEANHVDPERLEALATWTQGLSSRMTAGHGLRQNLIASLPTCPELIREEVADLVARLNAGVPTARALRQFAEDLDDHTGDKLCLPLILAADAQPAGLAGRLNDNAASAAEAVRNRRRLDADRAGPRTTVRIVTIAFIAMTTWTLLTGGDRVDAYREPAGQVVLLVLISAFIGLLLVLRRMSTITPLPRFIPASEERTR